MLEIKNWRPLTLLNVDYKIFSKTIANRIQLVFNDIIHKDQTGFMTGRYMGGGDLLQLTTLLEHCEDALIIIFDFE